MSDTSFQLLGFDAPNGFADYLSSEILLTGLDWAGGAITNVSFVSSLEDIFNLPGEGQADALPTLSLSWTADSISVGFDAAGSVYEWRDGGVGTFQINAAQASVPSPAPLALLGLGLAGLGWTRRKQA